MGAFLWFLMAVSCYFVAKKKNRRGWLWLILGIFFSYLALCILLFKKRLPPKEQFAKQVMKEIRPEQPQKQQQRIAKREPSAENKANPKHQVERREPLLKDQSHRKEQVFPPVPPVSNENKQLLNINLASEADFQELPGITTILAKRAVTIRNTKGNYSSIEEFCHELGLSELKLERIKPLITAATSIDQMPSYAGKGRTVDY